MKWQYLLGFLGASYLSLAHGGTVRPDDVAAPAVRASNSPSAVSLGLIVDRASGDGSTESDPVKTYVPMGGDADHVKATLFTSSSLLPVALNSGTMYMEVELALAASATTTEYLHASVKIPNSSDGHYMTFALRTTVSQLGSAERIASFTVNEMCDRLDASACTSLKQAINSNSANHMVYFFLASTQVAPGQEFALGDHAGGVFYRLYFSDKLPTGTLQMSRLYRGDGRLFADYTGGEGISLNGPLYKNYVVDCADSTCAAGDALGETRVGGVSRVRTPLEEPSASGKLDIRNLQNGQDYRIALGQVSKFYFASPISNMESARPEEIQALLEKQSCFLLTAGFQREHPVLDYFRGIRDNWLVKVAPGRAFVSWYYREAPQYAPTIYTRPWLSALVRGMGYTAYYAFHAFPYFLALLAVAIAVTVARSRKLFSKML